MAATAWLRKLPGFRLKESVDDGNCPWCGMDNGAVVVVILAIALSGTSWPVVDLT